MAAWFIYINRVGFNGLYRGKSRGECTTPYGKGIGRGLESLDPNVLRQCSKALTYADVADSDYLRALEIAREGDFVYLDPPYVPTSKTACFTRYCGKAFGNAEQVLLRDTARDLRERGVHVLLSNSDTPMVRELYRDFIVDTVAATRTISCKASCRGACKEVMIY
jgi:DNA adenine methylase